MSSRSTAWKFAAVFALGALVGALAAVQVVPASKLVGAGAPGGDGPGDSTVTTGGSGGPNPTSSTGPGGSGGNGTTGGSTGAGPCTIPANLKTPGVTSSEIRLATTVVDSGIGASFLRDVRFAMEAVRIKINQAGGICGRRLTIRYIDDGWVAADGARDLATLIKQDDVSKQIFAIPVGPSSEGLKVEISNGDIDNNKMPVVGTDGLLIDQYKCPKDQQQTCTTGTPQPWVWPVASATVASARIMVQDAKAKGASSASDFSVVYDKNYKFGKEGAQALNAEVKRLFGGKIDGSDQQSCAAHYCGIQAGQSSYSSDVTQFKPAKIVILFLEPQTALTWMNDPNTNPANYGGTPFGVEAAQPLFTRDFAVNCQSKCDQMQVWTSFKPYIEQYKNDPFVREYVQDLSRANPQADEFNAFAEGGYVGMLLLVDALKRVGGNLTREGLKQALDSTCLSPGLTIQSKLCWTTGSRFANYTMQQFTIQYKGTFSGWRAGSTIADPEDRRNVGIG